MGFQPTEAKGVCTSEISVGWKPEAFRQDAGTGGLEARAPWNGRAGSPHTPERASSKPALPLRGAVPCRLRVIGAGYGSNPNLAGLWAERTAASSTLDSVADRLPELLSRNPDAGREVILAYAWAVAEAGKPVQGIVQKYSEVLPKEPNPYDSLAEAQMAASRLVDAEASFRKAFEVSPEFYIALQGVAQTRFLRNDWNHAFKMLTK